LSVVPDKPGIGDRATVPTDKPRDLKRPLEIQPDTTSPEKLRKLNQVPSSTKPGEEVPEIMRPPKVIVPLSDVVLEELMPVIHTTIIDAGVPMASVRNHF